MSVYRTIGPLVCLFLNMIKSVIAKRIQIDTVLMFFHKNVQNTLFNINFVSSKFDVFEHSASPEWRL